MSTIEGLFWRDENRVSCPCAWLQGLRYTCCCCFHDEFVGYIQAFHCRGCSCYYWSCCSDNAAALAAAAFAVRYSYVEGHVTKRLAWSNLWSNKLNSVKFISVSFLSPQQSNWTPLTENGLTAQSQKVHQFVSHIVCYNSQVKIFKVKEEGKKELYKGYVFLISLSNHEIFTVLYKWSYWMKPTWHAIQFEANKKCCRSFPSTESTRLTQIYYAWDCNQDR